MRQAETSVRQDAAEAIEPFAYPDSSTGAEPPDWSGWQPMPPAAPAAPASRQNHAGKDEEGLAERLAEEARQAFAAGCARGREQERAAQAAALRAAEERGRRQAAELIEAFAGERDRYLQAVEHEVVRLALAIAARILRREAQMDPLLLTGAVRVALGQLAGATEVHLRVPAAELELWTEAMALVPNLALKPIVTAADDLELGDCVLESRLGTVDLGLRAQLAEIERGFFDRAGASSERKDAPREAAS